MNPLGSSLEDFERVGESKPFWGLFPAEKKLLEATRLGKECCVSCSLPVRAEHNFKVRADFLRFLLLGGDKRAPVHQRGLLLHGAYVDSNIDLCDSEIFRPLLLKACLIDGYLLGKNAKFRSLSLPSTQLKGINCDNSKFEGDVILTEGFCAEAEVRFVGSNINGNFTCSGGKFNGAANRCGSRALFFSFSQIAQKVSLNKGFAAKGEVRGVGAAVGGHLDCRDAQFSHPGAACHFDGAKIGGAVFLGGNFEAKGAVHFLRARVGGDFNCIGGKFQAELDLDGIQISHKLRLNCQTKIGGEINLAGAYVRILSDSIEAWPDGKTRLDGFTYGRIDADAPVDASSRKKWLKRQPSKHLDVNFRPQPFQQLIKVLREMGCEQEAEDIAILKEEIRLRRSWYWRGSYRSWKWNPVRWVRWLILEKAVVFGHRTRRIFIATMVVWLISAFLYHVSSDIVFAPADPIVFLNEKLEKCVESWPSCNHPRMLNEHTTFVPLIYSADVLLPIVQLGQERAWTPMIKEWTLDLGILGTFEICRYLVIGVMWFEIIFGWFTSFILAAFLTGVFRKD